MTPFHLRRPEIGCSEYRSMIVRDSEELPGGEYGFVEHYCEGIDCDCRRTILTVLSPQFPGQILATISYGWESPEFYEKHVGPFGAKMARPFLDPLGHQSRHAAVLLDYFERVVLSDRLYVERLKRHYALFKQALRAKGAGGRARSRKARSKSSKRKKRRRGKRR
jgi:hypothetical protein